MKWLFLLLTAASHFQDFPNLRAEERWEQIIASGERALESATTEEAMKIHGQLASSHFFLGHFESAKKHATLCYELALSQENQDQQVHGLYLLSAVARAEGDFANAKALAFSALPLSQGELKAKVLFNLGAAAADDPEGNLYLAQNSFEEALTIFECAEDQQRTTIRLGKVYLLQGKVTQAAELLKATLPLIQSKRLTLHAEYLSAQIEKALGHIDEARAIAKSALIKAEELGALKDAQRLKDFCEGL